MTALRRSHGVSKAFGRAPRARRRRPRWCERARSPPSSARRAAARPPCCACVAGFERARRRHRSPSAARWWPATARSCRPSTAGSASSPRRARCSPTSSVAENVGFGLHRGPERGPAGSPRCLALVGLDGLRAAASPTSSPAASSSGSRSPGRWPPTRRWSCSTSRSPPSTPGCAPQVRADVRGRAAGRRGHRGAGHPRPRRGARHGRSGGGAARRPGRAGRRTRRRSTAPRPPSGGRVHRRRPGRERAAGGRLVRTALGEFPVDRASRAPDGEVDVGAAPEPVLVYPPVDSRLTGTVTVGGRPRPGAGTGHTSPGRMRASRVTGPTALSQRRGGDADREGDHEEHERLDVGPQQREGGEVGEEDPQRRPGHHRHHPVQRGAGIRSRGTHTRASEAGDHHRGARRCRRRSRAPTTTTATGDEQPAAGWSSPVGRPSRRRRARPRCRCGTSARPAHRTGDRPNRTAGRPRAGPARTRTARRRSSITHRPAPASTTASSEEQLQQDLDEPVAPEPLAGDVVDEEEPGTLNGSRQVNIIEIHSTTGTAMRAMLARPAARTRPGPAAPTWKRAKL